jgi:hypothetical protein
MALGDLKAFTAQIVSATAIRPSIVENSIRMFMLYHRFLP